MENELRNLEKRSSALLLKIFDYFTRISEERNVNKILHLLADLGRDIVRADRCTMWLYNEKEAIIYTTIAHGVDKLLLRKGEGLAGYAIETGEELVINDPYNDTRFNVATDKQTGYKTREIIVIPVRNSKGDVIGAFQALNKQMILPEKTPENLQEMRFTTEDLDHLRMVASFSGSIIENTLLTMEIEQTQKEIITILGEACEMRSHETGNHVKRVALYAELLGREAGLNEKDLNTLIVTAPLHDIGKIGIPDAILLKPGILTREEFNMMKTHTHIGYEILRHSDKEMLQAAAIIANEHHEKYDGTGYPHGLEGKEIHIFGRIVAICDVFDALISSRVYKGAWEVNEIIHTLQNERSNHFDPHLLDLFLENLPEMVEIHEENMDFFNKRKDR